MRALLDTQSFLWFIEDNPRHSTPAKAFIADGTNAILLSVASLWEMAMKISLGKFTLSDPFATFISQHLDQNNSRLHR